MWKLSLVCDFMRKFVGTGSKGKPHVSSKSAMAEHNLHSHANIEALNILWAILWSNMAAKIYC